MAGLSGISYFFSINYTFLFMARQHVSFLKSSHKAVILLGREQIRKYAKEPYGTIYLRWRLARFLVNLCGSQDFVPPLLRK